MRAKPPPLSPAVEHEDCEAPWECANAPHNSERHDMEYTVDESVKVIGPANCLVDDGADVEENK